MSAERTSIASQEQTVKELVSKLGKVASEKPALVVISKVNEVPLETIEALCKSQMRCRYRSHMYPLQRLL